MYAHYSFLLSSCCGPLNAYSFVYNSSDIFYQHQFCVQHYARHRRYKREQEKTWTFYFTSGLTAYNSKTQNKVKFIPLLHKRGEWLQGGMEESCFSISALPCQLQGFILKVTLWSKMAAGAPAMATTFHTAGMKRAKKGAPLPLKETS